MSMEDLLKSLRADYIAELPAKIATIQALVREERLEEVREAFHKLKGTGKTYGLPEVSLLAELVEDTCRDNPAAGLAFADVAVLILPDIVHARRADRAYALEDDTRFGSLKAA